MCFLIIHVSSLQKCLLKSLAHCYNFLLSCRSSLYILVVVCLLSHVALFYDPVDCSPPDSSVHRLPRARILKLSFPSPKDLHDSRIEPKSPPLAGGFFTTEPPGKPIYSGYKSFIRCMIVLCFLLCGLSFHLMISFEAQKFLF